MSDKHTHTVRHSLQTTVHPTSKPYALFEGGCGVQLVTRLEPGRRATNSEAEQERTNTKEVGTSAVLRRMGCRHDLRGGS